MAELESKAIKLSNMIGSVPSLILHTIFFVCVIGSTFFGVDFEKALLVLTTVVSLEAIYLSIFIQMSVNRNTKAIEVVESDLDVIQEDVKEISDDVHEIQEDVKEISDDIDEIQEDVESIEKDIDEIQEDVEEITEAENETAAKK